MKQNTTEPPLLKGLIIILNLIIYAWVAVILYNTLITPKNPPESQIERNNSGIILVQGNSLKASAPVVHIEPRVLGIMFNGSEERTWDTRIAFAIMMAESGGRAGNINWKDYHRHGNCWGSFGLFQLACFRGTKEELLDPEINTQLAYELWKREGWWPWSVFKNERYLNFLN